MKFGIVLDSNTYIQDLRMNSPRFVALHDYVLKTESEILLFKLVEDEVLANYRRLFQEKVLPRWEKFRPVLMSEDLSPKPVLALQEQELQKKLIAPMDGLKVMRLSDYSGVDIEQVISRGVNRTPPASSKGEELRDVILWLATLAYARKKKRKIVFITKDGGFWEEGTDLPASQIVNDMTQTEGLVTLYRTIEAFLAANTLSAKAVDTKWANELFVNSKLSDLVLRRILAAKFPAASLVSQVLNSYEFESGALYELGSNAYFAELSFKMSIAMELKTYVIRGGGSSATSSSIILDQSFFWPKATESSFLNLNWKGALNEQILGVEKAEEILILRDQNPSIGAGIIQPAISFFPSTADTLVQNVSVTAFGKFLIRLESNQPTEVKLDNYQILSVSPATSS